MNSCRRALWGLGIVLALAGALIAVGASAANAAKPRVSTIDGFKAPGTPEKFNKVRIVKYGSPKAEKVLVLNPGTSAGGTFFGPFAKALTKELKGWQVWAIERRENLLEDHSRLEQYRTARSPTRTSSTTTSAGSPTPRSRRTSSRRRRRRPSSRRAGA